MNNKEKSIAFSIGAFDEVYSCIAEHAVWIVVEENTFAGRAAIIQQCKKVADYFKTITTHFDTHSIIEENNNVVINGTAAFFNENKCVSFLSACDLYTFNDEGQIVGITSYCIERDLKS